MNESHFHRLKPGWRSRAYQWLIVAELDRAQRRGTILECRCDEGARQIAQRSGALGFDVGFDEKAAA